MNPQKGIKTSVVRLTPTLAQKYLDNNVDHNRTVRQTLVDKYIRDMREGRWLLNGEPVILNSRGELVDGQHRCHAVVRSGTAVDVVVVEGIDDEAMQTVDIGATRSVGDMLRIGDGVQNGQRIATVAAGLLVAAGNVRPTKTEVASFAGDYLDEIARAVTVSNGAGRLFGSCKLVGAAAFLIAQNTDTMVGVDPWPDVSTFFDALDTGANLAADNPILLLRNRILRNPALARARSRRDMLDGLATFFYVWNLWQKGERRTKFAAHPSMPSTLFRKNHRGKLDDTGELVLDWRIF